MNWQEHEERMAEWNAQYDDVRERYASSALDPAHEMAMEDDAYPVVPPVSPADTDAAAEWAIDAEMAKRERERDAYPRHDDDSDAIPF